MKTSLITLAAMVLTTVASHPAHSSEKKILVVVSGANALNLQEGKVHPTGFFLSELAGPTLALQKNGYELVFANPNGKTPAMDVVSDDPKWFASQADYAEAKQFITHSGILKNPRILATFSENELKTFSGIFIPGGHAPMEDLWNDKELGRILSYFHENQLPTALICHGPIALLSTMQNQAGFAYTGYAMTIFSTTEEKQEEAEGGALGGKVNFYPDVATRNAGAVVTVGAP